MRKPKMVTRIIAGGTQVYGLYQHPRTGITQIWRASRAKPLGLACLFIFLILCIVSLAAPIVARYDPTEFHTEYLASPPNSKFWFGTDPFGRDIFSRVVYAGRISLGIGLAAAAGSVILGTVIGAVSAYVGGRVDLISQRVFDVLMGFPPLLLGLVIVAVLGTGLLEVTIAFVATFMGHVVRVVRSSVLSIKELPYILAAESIGAQRSRIILRHILPNVMAPVIIMFSLEVGGAMLFESSLSFLGLGTQEPNASWGAMLSGSIAEYARVAPWLAVFPGIILALAVFCTNIIGDTLRDVLDPHLRGR